MIAVKKPEEEWSNDEDELALETWEILMEAHEGTTK
ncbi:hypothetical protein A2U01_0074192, partial [Trifolium medium]|nr:hypothetical protein [Trifolium medium]